MTNAVNSSVASPSAKAPTQVGVLALQGAFAKHISMLQECDASLNVVEVKTPTQLSNVDALVIPGGESSTISKLLDLNQLRDPIASRIADGMPVFGTCAGLILLAGDVLDGRSDQASFGALDMRVRRNGYGRQLDSFETDLDVAGLEASYRAVFIRAPKVEAFGPSIEVLASVDEVPVLVRSGSVLASSFHPELTGDVRLHQLFLAMVATSSDLVGAQI